MNEKLDRLYELLPVVYRERDAKQGYPLRALLQVIAEQVNVVEEDIAQLYENWFIETCQDWVVPYIGDLIGYRLVHEAGEPGEVTSAPGQQRNKILIPRREVAKTIHYRRRKGTLAMLEQLANDVAGWPSRAVEFYKLLGWTQHLNHQRPKRGRTVDLRNGHALDLIDGPFDALAHTIDVHRINSRQAAGRYNIPSTGLFVWRPKTYPVSQTPAYCLEEIGPHCYTFSVLGNDTPLYSRAEPETEPTHIAEELNLPVPIRRRAFEDGVNRTQASDRYYGQGKSLAIWAPGWSGMNDQQPIPREKIIPADLTDWHYRPPRDHIAVDPVLGRIVFPPSQLPKKNVRVSYHFGFSADIGGGEYDRPLTQPEAFSLYRVGEGESLKRLNEALAKWTAEKPDSAIIEITDSGVYVEPIKIQIAEKQSLQIRAANRARPVIRLLDWQTDLPDAMHVTLGPGSRFTLDGLLITGRGVHVRGEQCENNSAAIGAAQVTIRHSTLVPGWALHSDCRPKRPAEPSLELFNVRAHVAIEHSIIGSIQINEDEVTTDPIPMRISDSILDATSQEREAIGAPGYPLAHAVLTIARSTVFGQIQVHAIKLAENSIFAGLIKVARRQLGCMRFCSVSPGSRTPRRYKCQPDLTEQAITEELHESFNKSSILSDLQKETEIKAAQQRERDRVRPQFNSTRYGTATYCQLSDACAEEIIRGADDEAEMGVFHDLFQPQREANLRARLDEYTPAGMDAGIIFVN
ncbi:hypothetical protein KJ068_11765 [bacterium]|nr:hypothetical protein [bacterium]